MEYFGNRSQYKKYHPTIPSSINMNGEIKARESTSEFIFDITQDTI